MSESTSILNTLHNLPGSYQGPQKALAEPYAVVGLGQAALAGALLEGLVGRTLTRTGTQLVLESPDVAQAAGEYAALAEVGGAAVVRGGLYQKGHTQGLDFLAPAGIAATYHLAQYAAYATGHAEEAAQAERLLTEVAQRCDPAQEHNPARALAWTLWSRTPLLLADSGSGSLPLIWQNLLARVGKSLAVPIAQEPLLVVTGAFEGQHERGDGKVALILGDETDELALVREVLESRIDEVVNVPFFGGAGGYADELALWYYGAWVAYYLAERHNVSAEDSPALREVLRVQSGEGAVEEGLEA